LIGSAETGTVELDAAEIRAAVTDALPGANLTIG